jgi:hypothetical protein
VPVQQLKKKQRQHTQKPVNISEVIKGIKKTTDISLEDMRTKKKRNIRKM